VHRRLLISAGLAAVLATGCGGGEDERYALTTPPEEVGAKPLPQEQQDNEPAPGEHRPTRREAQRLRPLVAGWAAALRHGDVERASSYFALPAIVSQGEAVRLRTRAEVRAFNAALPCGARVLGIGNDGRYVVATFRLTHRAGVPCAEAGQLVRVAFVIRGRKFAEWRQVPDAPGADPVPQAPEADVPPLGGYES
jgi:hypothetical protein